MTGVARIAFAAMGGAAEICIGAVAADRADAVAALAIAEVRRIEHKYSRYRTDSVTSAINAAAGSAAGVACDDETLWLLDYADHLYTLSDGLFDITSGILRRAWDFASRRVPRQAELDDLLGGVGWRRVERDGRRIRLPAAGMELDFGGFGKEYAADCAGAVLAANGIASGYVNLGGDIRVVGPQPDGQPWLIGIRNPRQADAIVATVPIGRGALATSGDYEKYFELDGQRYCHILNPRTGWPVGHWCSVSVVAELAIKAGSYATIAMLREAAGLEFLRNARLGFFCIDRQRNVFSL